jgi:hypothetical protein
MSRSALGSTQPPIHWVLGADSPGVKQQGCEADHSFTSSAEVQNGGQSDTGVGFPRVLQFPQPVFIPSTAQYSLIILLSLYSLDTPASLSNQLRKQVPVVH